MRPFAPAELFDCDYEWYRKTHAGEREGRVKPATAN
jgi:hypothetical protein